MTEWDNFKNMLNEIKDLSKIGSGNLISGLISAFFFLTLASILGSEDYGEVSYYLAICGLVFTICYFGAGHTIVVFTAKDNKHQSSIFFIAIVSAIVASTVLFFIFHKIEMSLFVIGSTIFGLAISEVIGFKLYNQFFKNMIIQRILLVILGIGLYFIFGINGVILGYALSFFPFIYRIIRSFQKTKIDFNILKIRKNFIFHSYILDISRNFPLYVDKLVVLPLFGFALLGNYQLGVQVVIFLAILPESVFQFMLPKEAKGEQNKKIHLLAILISTIFSLLSYFFAPIVIPFLFPHFFEAVKIVQIMGFAIIPITINYMFISKFLANEKSKIVMIGSGIYLIVQIIGIILLGNIYGINGAAVALIIGAVSQSIWYYLYEFVTKKN